MCTESERVQSLSHALLSAQRVLAVSTHAVDQRTWEPSDLCTCPLGGHSTVFSLYRLMDIWAVPRFGPPQTILLGTVAGLWCERMSSSVLATFGVVGSLCDNEGHSQDHLPVPTENVQDTGQQELKRHDS